jgi:L-ribulose-5-phosphate 3-epimerase
METSTALTDSSFRWGIYEKALGQEAGWPALLAGALAAGYQFLEISIDESDERLARLQWPAARRRELHEALDASPVKIDTMCLSGHRRFALGSVSKDQREKALTIMRRAIDFAAEFGLRIVQVAGYDVHYEPSTDQTRQLYLEAILRSAQWARESCVMLALENVECPEVDSMEKDVQRELRLGGRSLVGIHLKDTRIREFRRVPFGTGLVDFDGAFRTLAEMGYRGIFMVEMWNEAEPDPVAVVKEARRWLGAKLRAALAAL